MSPSCCLYVSSICTFLNQPEKASKLSLFGTNFGMQKSGADGLTVICSSGFPAYFPTCWWPICMLLNLMWVKFSPMNCCLPEFENRVSGWGDIKRTLLRIVFGPPCYNNICHGEKEVGHLTSTRGWVCALVAVPPNCSLNMSSKGYNIYSV